MANEMKLVFEQEVPIPFTVADGTSIAKGTLLKMTDPMTAVASDGSGDILAGIAAEDKVASDGNVKIGVYRKGIFLAKASGAIVLGAAVSSHGSANLVKSAAASENGADILGHVLETASEAEEVLVAVNVGAGGNQVN